MKRTLRKIRCFLGMHDWRKVPGTSVWQPSQEIPGMGWQLCQLACQRCGARCTADEIAHFQGYDFHDEVR